MRIYSRDALKWKEDKLFLKDELQCYLIQDKKHSKMFWIKWPDGSMSSDYANYTRQREWAVKMTLRELNNGIDHEMKDTEETGQGEALDAIN